VQTMGDAIDLTGDGGVIKTILRKSKADAVGPTENFPLVDGMFVLAWRIFWNLSSSGLQYMVVSKQDAIYSTPLEFGYTVTDKFVIFIQ